MSGGQTLFTYGFIFFVMIIGGFLLGWRLEGLRFAVEVVGILGAILAVAFGVAALGVWLAVGVIP